jgi:hypothetical protein
MTIEVAFATAQKEVAADRPSSLTLTCCCLHSHTQTCAWFAKKAQWHNDILAHEQHVPPSPPNCKCVGKYEAIHSKDCVWAVGFLLDHANMTLEDIDNFPSDTLTACCCPYEHFEHNEASKFIANWDPEWARKQLFTDVRRSKPSIKGSYEQYRQFQVGKQIGRFEQLKSLLDLLKNQKSRLVMIQGPSGAGKTLFLRYCMNYFGEREVFRGGISMISLKDVKAGWQIEASIKRAEQNLALTGAVALQQPALIIFDKCEILQMNASLYQRFKKALAEKLDEKPKLHVILSYCVPSGARVPKLSIQPNESFLDFPILSRRNAARVLLSKCYDALPEKYRSVEALEGHRLFNGRLFEFLLSEIQSIATRINGKEKNSSLDDLARELDQNGTRTVSDAFTVALE